MKLRNFLMILFVFFAGSTSMVQAQTVADMITAGNQAYTAKDYAKAVESYKAAVKMDPNSAAGYQGLGNSYYGLGQKTEALAAYEKALQLNPDNTALASFVQSLRAQVAANQATGASSPARVVAAAPAETTVVTPAAAPAASAMAPAASTASSSANKFELDFMGGVAISGATSYDMGFGGGVAGYVPLDKTLSLGGSLGYYTFNVGSAYKISGITQGFASVEILGSVKYRFEGNGLRPYLLAGVGASLYMNNWSGTYTFGPYTITYTPTSTIYPMAQVGGGVEFAVGNDMNIFLQGKYSILISSGGTLTYIPLEAGLSLNI